MLDGAFEVKVACDGILEFYVLNKSFALSFIGEIDIKLSPASGLF